MPESTAGRFKEHNGLRIAAIHNTGALFDWNKAHPDKQAGKHLFARPFPPPPPPPPPLHPFAKTSHLASR